MGNVIKRCTKKHITAIMCLSFLLVSLCIYAAWKYNSWHFSERNARVELNNLIYSVENHNDQSYSNYSYVLTDTNGTVLQSTSNDCKKNDIVDLHTLGGARKYVVPVQLSENQTALLCVDFSKAYNNEITSFFVVTTIVSITFLILEFLILLSLYNKMKKDVLSPVEELHSSVNDIVSGNSNTPVKYDYEGEVGSLCHDFEKMRDELSDSRKREEILKDKIHIMYGSISHDLKTSIATITGYLESIIYGVTKSDEDVKIYAQRCLNKTQIINTLTDDILEHSKAEVDNLSINKEEVYAADFFEPILKSYKEDSVNKQYFISYNLPDKIIINIDQTRISEVMQNIITNSIKYGNHVNITVTFSIISEPYKALLISIKDDGPGIDAVDLPFIFNAFYRGNKARTQDIPGSGLGLNICKYIVEAHGGRIECDSIVGEGTEISFSINI